MSRTLINGSEQILSASVPWSAMSTGAIVPTTSLIDGAKFVKSDGTIAMASALSLGGFQINNVASGTSANDAANVGQLNALKAGFQIHWAQTLSSSNIASLSGLPTVDGVTMSSGKVVLLIAQTTGSQNGPWVVGSGAWSRPTEWASAAVLPEGQYFIIDADGTSYKNTKYFVTNTGSITVDTTVPTFVQDQSGTTYSAAGVLALIGSTFSLNLGVGVKNDGSGNLALKLADSSLSVGASGLNITPGSAAQIVVTNAGATAASMVSVSGDVTLTAAGVTTVSSTSGSGFLKYGALVSNETVGGVTDGVNTSFTLAYQPYALDLYLNGVHLEPGSGNDYTISGTAITLLFAPAASDKLRAGYAK